MRAAVVTEAGPLVGYGHLGRLVSLCQAFRAAGDVVRVACSEGGHPYLEGFGLTDALGGFEEVTSGADWIIVDCRAPVDDSAASEMAARSRLCLVDDPGPGRGHAALVVDPPTGSTWPPAAGRRLSGSSHALLREEFRAAKPRPDSTGSVLVSLGGSDPAGLTAAACVALRRRGLDVTAVEGPGFAEPLRGNFDVLRHVHRLADQYLGRALLVCGFGHSLLEAARMGVPAVYVTWSDAQLSDALGFERSGWARFAGSAYDAEVAQRVGDLATEITGSAAWGEMSAAGASAVDGLGALRVADVMRGLARQGSPRTGARW